MALVRCQIGNYQTCTCAKSYKVMSFDCLVTWPPLNLIFFLIPALGTASICLF